MIYGLLQRVVRTAWHLYGGLEVRGLEHVPPDGPFLLIANHQSILDPILIQAVCTRRLHTMAKSTQFAAPVIGWIMARGHAFPVRRYQIDPQAVRTALRRLEQGNGVGIYIEGERSWDGRLQAPRLGTLRLILKADVPVVPCTIAGSYDAWPRWAASPRPAAIHITFGAPIRFPQLHRRTDRERALPDTAARVMDAIRSGFPSPTAVSP